MIYWKIIMKKGNYKYSIVVSWSEEDKGWGIKVPELPGCFSFAAKFNDVPRVTHRAIELWVAEAIRKGVDIPEPTSTREFSGKFVARLHPELHRDLAIMAKMKGQSLNRLVEELLSDSLKDNTP